MTHSNIGSAAVLISQKKKRDLVVRTVSKSVEQVLDAATADNSETTRGASDVACSLD
jgi:hypothetical protein